MNKGCFCCRYDTGKSIRCFECGNYNFIFSPNETEDILSALSYFISDHPDDGAKRTKVAMKKLVKEIFKAKREMKE